MNLNLNLDVKKARKREFLDRMEKAVLWTALVKLIAPYHWEGLTGRPRFSVQAMLRMYFMKPWFTLSHPAMEEASFDTPLYRGFAQLGKFSRLTDEPTRLRFRYRLQAHRLRT